VAQHVPFDDHLTFNRLSTVTRLVSGASHEVNNALQVINGTVELLLESPNLPEPVTQALERIGAQSARAAAALAGVTALSRSAAEASAPVDLRDVVSRATALRRHSIGRAGLTIAVEPGDVPLMVVGNGPQLLQVLVNLIDNAEQALTGRPGGHIVVRAGQEQGVASAIVEDNGPGVPAHLAADVFAPFVTSRPRPDSMGLGLPVAKVIAEAHGGSLSVEPREHGAAFVLRLPLL
jgi:two-component system C4-dicarboxylate transport sensor histidine kinase DctB